MLVVRNRQRIAGGRYAALKFQQGRFVRQFNFADYQASVRCVEGTGVDGRKSDEWVAIVAR